MEKRLAVFFMILILMSGCSSLPVQVPGLTQPTATIVPTISITAKEPTLPAQPTRLAVSPAAPTSAPTASLPSPKVDAEKVVILFLDGQKAGTDFALTSKLFSAAYAAKIKDDEGLTAILGNPETIGVYKTGTPTYSDDLLKSSVEGTVYLPQPTNVRFNLVIESGEWKIDEITRLSSTGEYPAEPEGVVLGFLTSYQEAPDRMSNFLTAGRRAQQPPGGATAMLQISGNLEGMVVQSAAVNPDPPSASIIVVIRAGGKEYLRKFLLTKDTSLWGIDAIEVTTE